jgi:hypothetical protein
MKLFPKILRITFIVIVIVVLLYLDRVNSEEALPPTQPKTEQSDDKPSDGVSRKYHPCTDYCLVT